MFAAGLHAFSRDDPNSLRQIELAPPGADDLDGASDGQDCEFQSSGTDTFVLSQLCDEGTDLGVGQRCTMSDAVNLPFIREQMIQMPAPSGRVFAGSVAPRSGPIEDGLDTPTDAGSRLGFG